MAGPLTSIASLTARPCHAAARWLGLAASDASDAAAGDDALAAVQDRLDAAYDEAAALGRADDAAVAAAVAADAVAALNLALAPLAAFAAEGEVEAEADAGLTAVPITLRGEAAGEAAAEAAEADAADPSSPSRVWAPSLSLFAGLCVLSALAYNLWVGSLRAALAPPSPAASPVRGALTAPLLAGGGGVVVAADHAERGGKYVRITVA